MITYKDRELYEDMMDDRSDMEKELDELKENYDKAIKKLLIGGFTTMALSTITSVVKVINILQDRHGLIEVEGVKGYILGLIVIIATQVFASWLISLNYESIPMSDVNEMGVILRIIVSVLITVFIVTIAMDYVPYINVSGRFTMTKVIASIYVPIATTLIGMIVVDHFKSEQYIKREDKIKEHYRG